MTQRDLNRAVARATGETVETIERLGFGPLDESADDDGPPPIDCGVGDAPRHGGNCANCRRPCAAA